MSSDSTVQKLSDEVTISPIERAHNEFNEMLQGSGPSAMVKIVADDMVNKAESQADVLKQYLEKVLDSVIDQVRIVVEQEYVMELRLNFLTLKENEMNRRITLRNYLKTLNTNKMLWLRTLASDID